MPSDLPQPLPLFYQEYGSGPPLLILHGLFGSFDNWHTLVRRFAAHRHVFALDQRNHGRSPHSPVFSYVAMAEDLRKFLDDRNLERVAVLGHSMGGKTAMQFAVTYPRRVSRLVVVDISPQAYGRRHDEILEALCDLDLKGLRTRADADKALSARIESPAVRQFLLKSLKREVDGTFGWKMNLPVIRDRYEEVNVGLQGEGAFDGPALFVRGTRSPYLSRSDVDAGRRWFPQAQVSEIDSGHWVHAEQPDAFFAAVEKFLSA